MIVGLLESGLISLTAWAPEVDSRAVFAQSTVRRFRRWLENDRIKVNSLYGPIVQEALSEWGTNTLYLALDTSMLWNQYCLIRISVIYRGRAVPLVWDVITHGSSSVAFATYRPLLDKALTLLPSRSEVIFLADRGFA
ncbi:transposase, partial [Arthrospira platensis SPKY2]